MSIFQIHKADRGFISSLLVSLVILFVALVINYYAGTYATEVASNPVTDIILSNTPVLDVDGIFVYGAIVLWVGIIIVLMSDIKLAPFTIKSTALFVFVRAIFITLTHIAPFPESINLVSNFILNKLTFGADLFFSGHTGLPFLMALIYWEHRTARAVFLGASIIFGVSAVLGHLHYSIDVLAAYFITYTIFHIAERLFSDDRVVFWESRLFASVFDKKQ
ncbi:MAG: phosphatase PAP2-related protein [Candidatus Liptonbacteria bacterium]